MARMNAVIAAAMLTCFLRSKKLGVFWSLYVVGAIGLASSVGMLADGWTSYRLDPLLVPLSLRCVCAVLILATLAGVWWWRRATVLPVAMVAILSYLLPWLPKDVVVKSDFGPQPWEHVGSGLSMYLAVGLGCTGLVYWVLKMRSKAIVNYGIGGFAATVLWFYLSSLLDKFGRSLGLIGLGVLFLTGGWVLERLRRQLVAGFSEDIA